MLLAPGVFPLGRPLRRRLNALVVYTTVQCGMPLPEIYMTRLLAALSPISCAQSSGHAILLGCQDARRMPTINFCHNAI